MAHACTEADRDIHQPEAELETSSLGSLNCRSEGPPKAQPCPDQAHCCPERILGSSGVCPGGSLTQTPQVPGDVLEKPGGPQLLVCALAGSLWASRGAGKCLLCSPAKQRPSHTARSASRVAARATVPDQRRERWNRRRRRLTGI